MDPPKPSQNLGDCDLSPLRMDAYVYNHAPASLQPQTHLNLTFSNIRHSITLSQCASAARLLRYLMGESHSNLIASEY